MVRDLQKCGSSAGWCSVMLQISTLHLNSSSAHMLCSRAANSSSKNSADNTWLWGWLMVDITDWGRLQRYSNVVMATSLLELCGLPENKCQLQVLMPCLANGEDVEMLIVSSTWIVCVCWHSWLIDRRGIQLMKNLLHDYHLRFTFGRHGSTWSNCGKWRWILNK